MRAIAGVVRFDGAPVTPGDVMPMLRALETSGFPPPGDDDCAVAGSAGLAQIGDTGPASHARVRTPHAPFTRGTLTIVADVRLDNATELARSLGAPHADETPDGNTLHDRVLSDCALLLSAYERWGRGCAERLLGDFAFAIWDAARQELYCARDHAGVKPLFFRSEPCRRFAFASNIHALAMLDGQRVQPNDRWMVDFLAGEHLEAEYTAYSGVARLPAAHWLMADPSGVEVREYWSPGGAPTLRLSSDTEYAEAFLEVFGAAVRRRLAPAGAVASMLSGGLDSSSIVAVAGDMMRAANAGPLVTYSTVFPDAPAFDESRFIDQVVQRGTDAHRIPFDHERHHPLGALAEIQRFHGEPVFAPNASQPWQLMERLPSDTPRIVLDGHGGDETVSHGNGYFAELARGRRWAHLARELHAASDAGIAQSGRLFAHYLGYGLDPVISQSTLLRGLRRGVRGVSKRLTRDRSGRSELSGMAVLAAPLRAELRERLREYRSLRPRTSTEHAEHLANVTSYGRGVSLEVLGSMARGRGVSLRFPFMDRDLVEFCLSLPVEQKRQNGWGRLVMRRAMAGLLPDPVRWRREKVDFLSNALRGLVNDRGVLDSARGGSDRLAHLVNPTAVSDLLSRARSGDLSAMEYFTVVRVTALLSWL